MGLFIDTNILLSFYHLTSEDLIELEKLATLIEHEEIVFYTTEQVIEETKRNRASKINDSFSSFKKIKLQIAYPAYCKDYLQYELMRNAQKEFEKLHTEIIVKINTDIEEKKLKADLLIQRLFAKAKIIKRTADIIEKSQLRMVLGNPPGKKGSLGDSINWVSLITETSEYLSLIIVSEDSDFFSPLNPEKIDDFLEEEWRDHKKGELSIYRKLSSFLKDHYPDINLTEESEKNGLIQNLALSGSFSTTHDVIAKLNKYKTFTQKQAVEIFNILIENNQVGWIFTDSDVNSFYKKLYNDNYWAIIFSDNFKEIEELFQEENPSSKTELEDEIPF